MCIDEVSDSQEACVRVMMTVESRDLLEILLEQFFSRCRPLGVNHVGEWSWFY